MEPDPLPSPRRLTIADAMILVATAAPAFAMARWFVRAAEFRVTATSAPLAGLRLLALASAALVPCAGLWTLTLLALRLRPPRPRWRELSRQPGWAALSVGGPLTVVGTAFVFAVDRAANLLPRGWPLVEALLLTPLLVGPGIAGSWLTLRMTGRWRRGRDWIDLLARLLGWYWILAGPVCFWVLNG